MTKITTLLRAHVGPDGLVWQGDGLCRDGPSGLTISEFVRRGGLADSADSVRVLGVASNAQLLVRLQDLRGRGVQVSSPAGLAAAVLQHAPLHVLHHLRQPIAGAAGRTWYELTAYACVTYLLLVEMQQAGGLVSTEVCRLLEYHPAWPALSFVPSLNIEAACRLLGDIVDPRWFRHERHPTRLNRLWLYLGLTKRNMAHLLAAGACHPDVNYARAANAVRAWYNLDAQAGHGTLWRIFAAAGGGPRGLLTATRRFVTLVYTVWLTALASHPEVCFDPQRFFRDPVEAEAYTRHVLQRTA